MPGPKRRGSGSSSPQKINISPKKETNQPSTNDCREDENAGDDEAFDRELLWCIERLESGLLASKSKLPTSQTHEWVRILKVLRNPKAAYVKKRQFMRSAFGDYRQKMSEEAKRYAAKTRKISMKPASAKDQKSKFIKKSCRQDENPDVSVGGSSSFCFNFNVFAGEGSGEVTAQSAEGGVAVNGLVTDSTATDKTNDTPCNFYKMESSDNSFKFNFTPADDT